MLAAVLAAVAVAFPVVHPDGRIGPFRIDGTTEAQLLARLGPPAKVAPDLSAQGRRLGRSLFYRCGRDCWTEWSFSDATGRLADFATRSPRFATARGARVGTPAARAAALERKRIRLDCPGYVVPLRLDARHAYVLELARGRVDAIVYLGPHNVWYDGLC